MGESAVVTVLERARAILVMPGVWCSGGSELFDEAGKRLLSKRCCLWEAIRRAAEVDEGLYGRLRGDARWELGSDVAAITSWNDRPGRTHAEVIRVLDVAIERERRRSA